MWLCDRYNAILVTDLVNSRLYYCSRMWLWPDLELFVNNSIGNNILALFSRESNSRIANVRLSVCLSVCYKNLSELLLSAIEPIDH